MVRVTNYFETQVRVPTSEDNNIDYEPPHHSSRTPERSVSRARSAFHAHIHGSASAPRKMTDEQMVSWYGKVLDSVRLRYRKLQRFARYDITLMNKCSLLISRFVSQSSHSAIQ
jgi:mitogen-activated protein kinase kinase kinase